MDEGVSETLVVELVMDVLEQFLKGNFLVDGITDFPKVGRHKVIVSLAYFA